MINRDYPLDFCTRAFLVVVLIFMFIGVLEEVPFPSRTGCPELAVEKVMPCPCHRHFDDFDSACSQVYYQNYVAFSLHIGQNFAESLLLKVSAKC